MRAIPLSEERKDRAKPGPRAFRCPSYSTRRWRSSIFRAATPATTPGIKKVARATATILNAAGVDFGILGSKENCCGESIRKAGDEELFKRLARENIKAFIDNGVKQDPGLLAALLSHLQERIPRIQGATSRWFTSPSICAELIEGRAGFTISKGNIAKKVTYHDPCYLGRHNGIVFDEPREVLRARCPAWSWIELADCLTDSLCCGGGGGGSGWRHPRANASRIRMQQAVDLGAEVLVTACPYCITNFEDSRQVLELTWRLKTSPR